MMSQSQGGSGGVLAVRRQSTEHTDEAPGQREGAGRSGLSVPFDDSSESEEDPDPPEDPLLSSLTELSVLERLACTAPKNPGKESFTKPTCLHDSPRLRVTLTEQDVEAAFAHLALAFRCDMFTLRRRVQVEERARDVAEENIQQELEGCRAALQRLGLACIDPKRKELVRQLEHSLTVLAGSIERAMRAAEKLGAVHQEARLSRSAEVMVQHVENLKRHHVREHAELEEMKRLIQQNSRNRQLAENRDDGEQRLKLPLMRTFQQASARRRVSIAVIPKQLTQSPSPESGRVLEEELAKVVEESCPSAGRQTCGLQEASTNKFFILHSDSSSSLHQSQEGAASIKCGGNRGHYTERSKPELQRRGSTSQSMKEEPSRELESGGLTEELEQLNLMSEAPRKELHHPWFFLSCYYWVFLWLLLLLIACLGLSWILELQKRWPLPPSAS